jgi:ATP-binding cassette, subfamily C (CFTR/MRP), member 1
MNKLHGSIKVNGSIAYVPQQPWIINGTVQQNILFGNKMNEELYKQVIECCALSKDLAMLSDGDKCEIGEKVIIKF